MPLERVSRSFKDVSASFQINPLNYDLVALKNESAISRSIRNIVLTSPGEKFFQPTFGSRVSESLFENMDEYTSLAIREEIESSIRRFEPRVSLSSVTVSPNFEANQYDVVIRYRIIGADVPAQSLEFVLQPTR
tara:strand:- start:921 stop:1322 length:402 start_codon:yes stop_codon:yes gene_type:complete